MAGSLDTSLRAAAKQAIADLGSALNSTITYTRKVAGTYNTATGSLSTTDTTYANIKVPIEFIKSEEDDGRELRQAKLSITPDLIGDNQPTFQDEVILSYAGANQTAQIVEITTTNYLFTLVVRF
tara:strand:+ start:505 stop:879 length:375 start_codon:yes stop_codon:yes gene_type:complete